MKAYRLVIPRYFPEVVSIYAAENASKVRFEAFRNMQDANYDVSFREFIDEVQITRSPIHDGLAANSKGTESLGWHDDIFYYGCFSPRSPRCDGEVG